MKQRFFLLDVIRTIAISLVLVAHIAQRIGSPLGKFGGINNFYYVSLGGLAITVFLILSGICLELNYGNKFNYLKFMVRRILRIYPVYYLERLTT